VRLVGHDLSTMTPAQLRQVWGTQVAIVFQDPMTALNPVVRIGRQITEALRKNVGLDKRAAKETALALLTSVGIPSPESRLRNYPHELSGGMRQRIMIAIALACGPKLLLADEPTTGLDVTVQAQILDLLAAQQRERSMAMILVSHDLGVVASRTDEILVMYAGKVVEQAPTETLFAQTRMPYTEALLRSIPKLADPSHTRLRVIPGRPPDLAAVAEGCRFAPRCPYVQDRCRREVPPLRTAGPDHLFACWLPVGSFESTQALAANAAAGVPAAVAFSGKPGTTAAMAGGA
jgi:peptide/nickel transport system ATP-binding protein